jgi:hypothetical protein
MSFLLVVFLIAFGLLFFSLKFKLFSAIKIEDLSLGSGTLLFIPYQGDYYKLMPTIEMVKKEISASFGNEIQFFGIYYDMPDQLLNKNKARAIIGGIVSDKKTENSSLLNTFLNSHKNYKTTSFKNLKGFGAKFPLFNFLNILSAKIRGYPKITQYGQDKGLFTKTQCSFEIYDYLKNELTISFPYSAGNENILFQSGYPIPENKPEFNKKAQ